MFQTLAKSKLDYLKDIQDEYKLLARNQVRLMINMIDLFN